MYILKDMDGTGTGTGKGTRRDGTGTGVKTGTRTGRGQRQIKYIGRIGECNVRVWGLGFVSETIGMRRCTSWSRVGGRVALGGMGFIRAGLEYRGRLGLELEGDSN